MDRILVGDALETLRTLSDNSVHCCATSPPYWALRNYGVEGQIGLEETPEQYVSRIVDVFREVRRVLHPSGTLWLNLGDSFAAGSSQGSSPKSTLQGYTGPHVKQGISYEQQFSCKPTDGLKPKDLVGIPWMVAFALRADGWYLRSDIIWAKPSCMPESVTDRPTKAHEYVFLMSKSERYFYDIDAVREPVAQASLERAKYGLKAVVAGGSKNPGSYEREPGEGWNHPNGKNRRSVWRINPEPFHGAHFACWPTKLVEPMILAGTSEHGCCAECGAPWVRVVERSGGPPAGSHMLREDRYDTPSSTASLKKAMACGQTLKAVYEKYGYATRETTGWQPTCKHSAAVAPCTVLDPFSGAGTTGLVARRHGRAFVGIELNPEYAKMALRRIDNEASLFNPRGIAVEEAV